MFLMSTTLWAIDIYDILRPIHEIIVWADGSVQSRIDRYVTDMNARVFGQTVVYTLEVTWSLIPNRANYFLSFFSEMQWLYGEHAHSTNSDSKSSSHHC